MWRRNPDATVRKLERAWEASGSLDDLASFLKEKVRAGMLDFGRLEVAAILRHPAARTACDMPEKGGPYIPSYLYRNGGAIKAKNIPGLLAHSMGRTPDENHWTALEIMAQILRKIQTSLFRQAGMVYGGSGHDDFGDGIDVLIERISQREDWNLVTSLLEVTTESMQGGLNQVRPHFRPDYTYEDADAELREKILTAIYDWSLGFTEVENRRRNPYRRNADEDIRGLEREYHATNDPTVLRRLIEAYVRYGSMSVTFLINHPEAFPLLSEEWRTAIYNMACPGPANLEPGDLRQMFPPEEPTVAQLLGMDEDDDEEDEEDEEEERDEGEGYECANCGNSFYEDTENEDWAILTEASAAITTAQIDRGDAGQAMCEGCLQQANLSVEDAVQEELDDYCLECGEENDNCTCPQN